jgi:hypothetical protein
MSSSRTPAPTAVAEADALRLVPADVAKTLA